MDEMKKCPFCAEEIKAEAIVCRYCGRPMPGYENRVPLAKPDYLEATKGQQATRSHRAPIYIAMVMLFVAIAFAAYMLTRPSQNLCNAETFIDRSGPLVDEWTSAMGVAHNTPYNDRGSVIEHLQELRREVAGLEVPTCGEAAKSNLIRAMDDAIHAYTISMDPTTQFSSIDSELEMSWQHLDIFKRELEKLKSQK